MNHLKEMFFETLSKDIIEKNFKVKGSKLLKNSLDPSSEEMIVTIAKSSNMLFLSIENEEGISYSFPINQDFIKQLNKLNNKSL